MILSSEAKFHPAGLHVMYVHVYNIDHVFSIYALLIGNSLKRSQISYSWWSREIRTLPVYRGSGTSPKIVTLKIIALNPEVSLFYCHGIFSLDPRVSVEISHFVDIWDRRLDICSVKL
jgi:hypothetical protein